MFWHSFAHLFVKNRSFIYGMAVRNRFELLKFILSIGAQGSFGFCKWFLAHCLLMNFWLPSLINMHICSHGKFANEICPSIGKSAGDQQVASCRFPWCMKNTRRIRNSYDYLISLRDTKNRNKIPVKQERLFVFISCHYFSAGTHRHWGCVSHNQPRSIWSAHRICHWHWGHMSHCDRLWPP